MGKALNEAAAQQNVLDAWQTTKSRLAWEPAPNAEVQAFTTNLLAHLTRGFHGNSTVPRVAQKERRSDLR